MILWALFTSHFAFVLSAFMEGHWQKCLTACCALSLVSNYTKSFEDNYMSFRFLLNYLILGGILNFLFFVIEILFLLRSIGYNWFKISKFPHAYWTNTESFPLLCQSIFLSRKVILITFLLSSAMHHLLHIASVNGGTVNGLPCQGVKENKSCKVINRYDDV
jgi:hypothetical protein